MCKVQQTGLSLRGTFATMARRTSQCVPNKRSKPAAETSRPARLLLWEPRPSSLSQLPSSFFVTFSCSPLSLY